MQTSKFYNGIVKFTSETAWIEIFTTFLPSLWESLDVWIITNASFQQESFFSSFQYVIICFFFLPFRKRKILFVLVKLWSCIFVVSWNGDFKCALGFCKRKLLYKCKSTIWNLYSSKFSKHRLLKAKWNDVIDKVWESIYFV